jgi:hypothetical protein
VLDDGRIASYDMTVISANDERAKRRDYHAVREHDGLTWQRFHQEVCLLCTSLKCSASFHHFIYSSLSLLWLIFGFS